MIDFSHIPTSGSVDIQTFYGTSSATLLQWQTWRKPRGISFVHIIGVGGGSSGGTGFATNALTAGGGQGGGSGAQSSLLISAAFIPDVLYIQAGMGGVAPTAAATTSVAGTITYVCVEPSQAAIVPNCTLLLATGGLVGGTAATATAGGVAGTAATLPTIAGMPLAAKGQYTLLIGQAGAAGGASTPTAGGSITLPAATAGGLMVTGGAGGGGTSGATAAAGGNITGVGFGETFPTLLGGAAAVGAARAVDGTDGTIGKNFMMNYGGAGGGAATSTAGGFSGMGGDGAPGCGGGGGGGQNTVNATVASPGNGGPGFVIITCW